VVAISIMKVHGTGMPRDGGCSASEEAQGCDSVTLIDQAHDQRGESGLSLEQVDSQCATESSGVDSADASAVSVDSSVCSELGEADDGSSGNNAGLDEEPTVSDSTAQMACTFPPPWLRAPHMQQRRGDRESYYDSYRHIRVTSTAVVEMIRLLGPAGEMLHESTARCVGMDYGAAHGSPGLIAFDDPHWRVVTMMLRDVGSTGFLCSISHKDLCNNKDGYATVGVVDIGLLPHAVALAWDYGIPPGDVAGWVCKLIASEHVLPLSGDNTLGECEMKLGELYSMFTGLHYTQHFLHAREICKVARASGCRKLVE